MLAEYYRDIASLLGLAGEITGRKKLQKMVYLAQNFGFPGLKESFNYHWFGPYSDSLAAKIGEMNILGIVRENDSATTPGGYPTYKYRLTKEAEKYFGDDIRQLQEYQPLIRKLNCKDSRFLEFAATLHFFLSKEYDKDSAIREVLKRKSEQRYSQEEGEQAFEFLTTLGPMIIG